MTTMVIHPDARRPPHILYNQSPVADLGNWINCKTAHDISPQPSQPACSEMHSADSFCPSFWNGYFPTPSLGVSNEVGVGIAHLIDHSWVPFRSPITHMIYLKPLFSHLAESTRSSPQGWSGRLTTPQNVLTCGLQFATPRLGLRGGCGCAHLVDRP